MAKKLKTKDTEKVFELKHRRNVAALERQIDRIYNDAAKEAANIAQLVAMGNFDPNKAFSFDDYPITHQRVDKLLKGLKNDLQMTIVNGVTSEWTLANNKNNELCNQVFGENIGKLTEEQYRRYYSTNPKALEAFKQRRTNGLNLSDRVWNYTNQFKEEIEAGVGIGLADGIAATEMATNLKQYLKYPDKLFRRVRDKDGKLHLSKAAKAFHPGQGVYRSSYKNARRLAATECNIAYRTADHERYQQLDFVVGVHVIRSNNHTLNGMEFHDICDELSGANEEDKRGRYPKDFKFTGWHPLCRCHVISILKTDKEMLEDDKRILDGKEPLEGSANEVKEMPKEFKEWVEDNEGRIQRARSMPYFLKDNPTCCAEVNKALEGTPYWQPIKPKELTVLEKAKLRHDARTKEQIEAIKSRWEDRRKQNELTAKEGNTILTEAKDYNEVDFTKLEKYIADKNYIKIREEIKIVEQQIVDMKNREAALADLIPDVHNWHKQFTMAELEGVHSAVKNKLAGWSSLSLENQAKKLHFEAVDFLGGNMKGVQQKYKTWEVSQKAYLKQYDIVNEKIAVKKIGDGLTDIEKWVKAHPKAQKMVDLLGEVKNAIANGESLQDVQKKADALTFDYKKRLAAEKHRAKSKTPTGSTTIDFPLMPKKEIDNLLHAYNTNFVSDVDNLMRPMSEAIWKTLTIEEQTIVTKYTQTYHYLNERLRNLTYLGGRPESEYHNDLPILTNVLNKMSLPQGMVVRRGTDDYSIRALGKNLSNVNVGDEFVDGAFLSTAMHRTKGLGGAYNMIIVMPKGTKGLFAEPFTHYNDHNKFDFETGNLWDGTSVETIGREFEWIAQRGCKYKVIKKSGRDIVLQLIGQLYDHK